SLKVQKPASGFLHITPGIWHPFQLEGAFKQPQVRNVGHFGALSLGRHATHRGQSDVDAMPAQRLRQFDGERPDTAHGVRGHQHASHWVCSNSTKESGFCSWMSLNSSKFFK